jgi:outer membrane protein assembly factor BamA
MKKILFPLLVGVLCLSQTIQAFEIERRRDQFTKQYGQLFAPLPYSLPGLGTGLLLVGSFANIADTTTDFSLIGFTGDAQGIFTFLDELFIVPDVFYLQYLRAHGFKFAVNQYKSRGMDSEKNDFYYGIGRYWDFNAPTFKLTFYDRMLEIGLGLNQQKGKFDKLVSPDPDDPTKQGDTVVSYDPPLEQTISDKIEFSVRLDYTDDYKDPRKGIRNIFYYDVQNASKNSDPSFDVLTNDLQVYVPVLEKSTIVFDLQISNAIIKKKGETNFETLKVQNGFNNCGGNAACEQNAINLANTQMQVNTNGTASFLGGGDRLRSYPQGRFQGAHMIYFATEFRWNFSESGGGQFDSLFFQDLVDDMQIAFFYENGSVSEKKSDLGKTSRSSFGSGFRLVNASGNIYRADLASRGIELSL